MRSFLKRVSRELQKNSLRDFFRKVAFYYFGRGRNLWALNVADWKRKKRKTQRKFANYAIPNRQGKEQVIVYVLPGTWIAGGIAVALKHANLLQEAGYTVYIVTQDLKVSFPWFRHQEVEVVPMSQIGRLLEQGIDILVATGWNSAPAADLLPARRKWYLIQLDERRFYDDPSLKDFVAETYMLPFEYVVIAQWMKQWLKEEFGHEATYVPNALDEAFFEPQTPYSPKGEKPRILIEGPIDVPFKGVAEAYETVKGLEAEIWLVSGRGKPPKEWKIDRFFEKVPLQEMPKVYASCDILLKMSTVESFCYPPLEMMACGGVPVILEVSGIEEYTKHEENCLIVKDATEARRAVERLLNDRDLYERLQKNALKTAQTWRWERSGRILEGLMTLSPRENG